MEFHTFGDSVNPAMLLIHGVMTPWQIWEPMIAYFQKHYYVIVPALDAHTEASSSEFVSIQEEALSIEKYVTEHCNGRLEVLCGLSMGGLIANRLLERTRLRIYNLILDGAPLTKMPRLTEWWMTHFYCKILAGSKARKGKTLERFKKDFLPEKYLDSYLQIADRMSEESVRNMMRSVCHLELDPSENPERTRILFMHGTKGNETAAIKSAEWMCRYYPEMLEKVYPDRRHIEIAVNHPTQWCADVDAFLRQKKEA